MKHLCGLLVLAMVLVFQPARAAQVNSVAAVVNGQPITMFDLQQNAMPELSRRGLNPNNSSQRSQVDAVLRKTLDLMINDILVIQEAKHLKINVTDADVDSEITRMYKSRRMTRQQFEAELAKQRKTITELRKDLKKSMLREKVMGQQVGRRVIVSNDEVKQYYEAHRSEMLDRRGLHMALIVYHPLAPIAEVSRKVKNGQMSWDEASRQYSVLPSRNKGGDNGPVQWERLNEEWRTRLNRMQPGDVTDLFNYNEQLKAQVRLFRPGNDQSPLKPLSLEEARPQIDAILRGPKAQERLGDYAKQLRSKAVIDIRM